MISYNQIAVMLLLTLTIVQTTMLAIPIVAILATATIAALTQITAILHLQDSNDL